MMSTVGVRACAIAAIGCCVALGAPLVSASDEPPATNQSLAIEPDAGKPSASSPDDAKVSEPPRYVRRKAATVVDLVNSPGSDAPWYRTGLGALTIVLALMLGVFWCLKRWTPAAKVNHSEAVRVLGRTTVGPRQSLAVVRFGRRLVLVGVSPDRMDAIAEMTAADEVAELTAQLGDFAPRTAASFNELLTEEAEEFAESTAEPFAPAVTGRMTPGAAGASNGLRALLSRLRSLQSGKVR